MTGPLSTPSLIALAIAGAACVTDVRTRRIPNGLTFGAAGLAVAFHASEAGAAGAWSAIAGWTLGTLLFLPFFLVRGMGGGDVKLLAALGAWLGPGSVVLLAIYTSIAGGVIGVAVALSSGYLRTACANIRALLAYWRLHGVRPAPDLTLESAAAPRLAYAIPIAIGTVVTLWHA